MWPRIPWLCAPELRSEIDELNRHIYLKVNDAVYKAGFSRRQAIYEREVASLFATLDELDARLAGRRFLFGSAPVETDWRLFTTLLRFDAVYRPALQVLVAQAHRVRAPVALRP